MMTNDGKRRCIGLALPFQGNFAAILFHGCYTDAENGMNKALTTDRRKSLP